MGVCEWEGCLKEVGAERGVLTSMALKYLPGWVIQYKIR